MASALESLAIRASEIIEAASATDLQGARRAGRLIVEGPLGSEEEEEGVPEEML